MSNLRITPVEFKSGNRELDKRTYLPFVCVSACPVCGRDEETDLRSQYLSYPTVGMAEKVWFHHNEDDESVEYHEWSEDVVIGLTLTAVSK